MLKPGFERQLPLTEPRPEEVTEMKNAEKIRARIRFDYRGKARPSRFFFGGKGTEEVAAELREQQAALWRNVPVQGVFVENIELGEIYSVYDEEVDDEVAFAPLELEVTADSFNFLIRFAVRDEFRRLKIVEPSGLQMSVPEMEQIFFEVHSQAKNQWRQKMKRYAD
ncbi:MAG TPA: hypothetical protein VFC74_08355 [Oscillospiraceae bacterium]|nr:hypothetical protein [Oscillospiraceae bacterium]